MTIVVVVLLSLFTVTATAGATTRRPVHHTHSFLKPTKFIATGPGKSDPKPKATPTPKPTPTPTTTPTTAPTPTPSPTATALPAADLPNLLLTQSDIDAIRTRLAAGLEPEKSAFSALVNGRVKTALAASPAVFGGPLTSGGVNNPLELALDRDGGSARDLAIAYAMSGDLRYAVKARAYLIAWSQRNTPTAYANCGDKYGGSYQSHGQFSFAYAYDLTRASGVYSAADRDIVTSWFRRSVDALNTFMDVARAEWVMTHPDYTQPYEWDATKSYHVYDRYVGGDNTALTQAARLAMARVSGYQTAVNDLLASTTNKLSVEQIVSSALTPRNDGDGVAGHPVPTPHVDVYCQRIVGRGGMFDYMTYNTRIMSVLVDMAENGGWSAAKVTSARAKLSNTWSYLARFFGPNAEADFNPTDVIDTGVCTPRFTLAYHDFSGSRFLSIINGGDRANYYEPQLLGPVTLTHSVPR